MGMQTVVILRTHVIRKRRMGGNLGDSDDIQATDRESLASGTNGDTTSFCTGLETGLYSARGEELPFRVGASAWFPEDCDGETSETHGRSIERHTIYTPPRKGRLGTVHVGAFDERTTSSSGDDMADPGANNVLRILA